MPPRISRTTPRPGSAVSRTSSAGPRSVALTVAALLAATVIESFGAGGPRWEAAGALTAVALTMAGGMAAARRPGSRWLFRSVLLVAAIDVALLVANGRHL